MKIKLFLLTITTLLWSRCFGVALNAMTSQNNSQNQVISINFDGNVSQPKLFISGNDLVLDFFQTSNSTGKSQFVFNDGFIHQVNVISVANRVRLIITGGGRYKYNLNYTANNVKLSFNEQIARPSMNKQSVGLINLNKNNTGDAATIITDINFRRDDDGGGIVEIAFNGGTSLDIAKERVGGNLNVTLNSVSFNSKLIKRIDVTDFATPIKYIDTKSGNSSLYITIQNRNNWDYALYQLQNKLVVNIRPLNLNTANAVIPDMNPTAKSNRVSFNFQNIEVRALLQLLADFSGYNILVSDSVTGTMSIKLNNVPWDQALNTILNAKGLGMKREGNVIRIAPAAEIAAINKQQDDNNKAQEAVEPLDTLTVRLKYAQAANVQSMIQKNSATTPAPVSNIPGVPPSNSQPNTAVAATQTTKLLSPRGSILIDARTNTVIINDTPSRLKDIKELIDKIDIPVKQVLIEARIVEANSNFEKDLGTRLLLAGVGSNLTVSNTLENGVTINQQGINAISANSTSGGSTGGTSGSSGISSFVNQNFGVAGGAQLSTIFSPNSDTLIGLEVDALELQSQGRTISSPKVMTANYQAANIQQGVQIPYQQASSAGNTNVAFVNATLSLQVTPQITEDGYILLNVNIQKDSPSTTLQVQGTPAIDTNSVTTQVRVKDGSTILVGGIYIDDQKKIQEQIPLLGDIPYLGWLFKSQSTLNSKKELLIFITPRIIANSLDNDN